MKILNLIKASKVLQYVLVGTVATGAVVGGVVVYNNVGKQPESKNNQEITEPVKELTEKDQSATELVLKDYEIELNTTEDDLNNINWLDLISNKDNLNENDKLAFKGVNFEEVDSTKAGEYKYYIRYDDKTYTGKIVVKDSVPVDTKKEDEKKNANTNTKNNSSSKNNSTNNNNTQANTQNTTNNTSNNNSNQLIPVGTTYSGNGTKVTVLDGNKARLEYNGGTWTTDIVDRTGAGVQYNLNFKHKAGSGSPKYYYQSSILFPMSMSVMSNNINGAGGVHISGVSSNLGSVVNRMYVGKANGYSCTPNLNSLNAGGNDGCSSWASTVKGDVSSPDYDYTTYYVFNDKMEVLGYVFLEARLKPESELVGDGDPHVNPENWNIKQLYK
jgi:hypothetical protein